MAKHYDNLDDVKSKLAGTIINYNDVPVVCKAAVLCEDDMESFMLHITNSLTGRNMHHVKLQDPKLNWTKFNLGYINYGNHGAFWFYRQPLRQYRQGLKAEQMKYLASERTPDFGLNFPGPCKQTEDMLLNRYPSIEEIEKKLKDGEAPTVAFHRDLALSWDKIHKDMILEHKGKLIGCMSAKMTDVKLSDDYEHLTETIKEVIGAR